MIKVKTVLVLGAGSSKEVGLPVSAELSARMATDLNIHFDFSQQQKSGDPEIAAVLFHAAKLAKVDPNEYLHAARRISAGVGMANSIDSFIDMHREDKSVAECGKLAIICSILRAERSSTLFLGDLPRSPTEGPVFSSAEGSWFFGLANMLFEGVDKKQLDTLFQNVSVINFNYDRCLEYFLIHAICAVYAIPHSDAETLLEGLRIWHPYGMVAALPGQRAEGQPLPFGVQAAPHLLTQLAKGIRTFAERVADPTTVEAPRKWLAEADTVLFMGFSFNEQNMKLLQPPPVRFSPSVFASAYGMSTTDVVVVRNRIKQLFGIDPSLDMPSLFVRNELRCAGLLKEYGLAIRSGIKIAAKAR